MKRKIDKHYIILALIAVLINIAGILYSYLNRGYFAVGGEIFIIPLILLMRFLVKDMRKEWERLWNIYNYKELF